MAAPGYDVVIVGSGASGGMAAYALTKKGVKCLVLDAGPAVDHEKASVLKPVYELPYRGFGEPGRAARRAEAEAPRQPRPIGALPDRHGRRDHQDDTSQRVALLALAAPQAAGQRRAQDHADGAHR